LINGWIVEYGDIKMDSFLDTNIIIKSMEYEYIKEYLRKKCFEYVSSQKKILISFVVEEELRRAIIKRKEMYGKVLEKIKNPYFQIDYKDSRFLNKEDMIFAETIYKSARGKNPEKLKKEFDYELDFLSKSLNAFLKNKVSDIAIKKSELNQDILSIIQDFIADFADCQVLTSAIQMQQEREQFLFVTADKHFDSGSYNFVEEELRLKKYKKPKLKNLLFEA
jgi:hypothetical protein